MVIVIALCADGLATKTIQYFVPGRAFSALDWAADCLGVLVAYPLFTYALRLPDLHLKLDQ